MATVPQVHPLWLAEARDGDVYAGRVVAWQVAEVGGAGRAATPVVAFTTPDGMVLETGSPRGPHFFLADTRADAVAAADHAAVARPEDLARGPDEGPPDREDPAADREDPAPGPEDDRPRGPGHPPVPAGDEDDDRRPPGPRSRALTLRRLDPDQSAGQEPGPAGRLSRRTAG